ncbi:MAG: DUF3187 family protein [Acidobacteriota bacterium]
MLKTKPRTSTQDLEIRTAAGPRRRGAGVTASALGVIGLLALGAAAPWAPAAYADDVEDRGATPALASDPFGAPLRTRDFTFPSYLLLSFAPQPAAPLTRGKWAFEAHYSVINNFQVSAAVEDYLEGVRNGERLPLDEADAAFILGLPEGQGFYIDGEFEFFDFIAHYGVTDRLDLGVGISYMEFSGGFLDGTIFDFHDQFGYGQQGRNFAADEQFQIVIGQDGTGLALLDGPPDGGFGDPSVFFRYYLGERGRWTFNVSGGVKIPLADEDFLSSGSYDFGLNLTAQASWSRHALFVNLSAVEAGEFENQSVQPPLLPSLHVSFMRAFGRDLKSRLFLQVLAAEHAFSDLFDSSLSELEVQVTLAFKRATRIGVFGIGLTENILAFDNTPDIGIHLSWGYLMD